MRFRRLSPYQSREAITNIWNGSKAAQETSERKEAVKIHIIEGMDLLQLLPRDVVLNHILNRLDFSSRIRAAAVCSSWRDLSLVAPPIVGMPHLCLTPWDFPPPLGSHSLLNLSSFTTKLYCCPARVIRSCGSRGPYLTLMTFSYELMKELHFYTIYNPFTFDTFQLPCTVLDHEKGSRHPLDRIVSAQVSSKPPNCVVVAINRNLSEQLIESTQLYICRPGNRDWVKVPNTSSYISDMIFYRGELYCIDRERIMAYDIQHVRQDDNFSSIPRRGVLVHDQKDVPCIACGKACERKYYLVESAGELLVVARHYSLRVLAGREPDQLVAFSVHRVDEEKEQLVRADELGDRMLFVEEGCSQSWSRPELEPKSHFFTENCIYFVLFMSDDFRLGKFPISRDLEMSVAEYHSGCAFATAPIWVTPTYPN